MQKKRNLKRNNLKQKLKRKSLRRKEPKKEQPKAEAKKEEPKKEEPKKEQPKAEAKKEEPKKEEKRLNQKVIRDVRSKNFYFISRFISWSLRYWIFKKAKENKIWNLKVINIRDYSKDNHGTVDDTPFGGGSGMLLRPDILASALDENIKKGEKIIYLSPRGKKFDQNVARSLSKEKNLNLICGHFEGVDQRLLETRNIEEYSLGDFVLSGGEPASFVLVDCFS